MRDLNKSIISYYDNTWLDYRALWINKKDRALHFGYYETNTETHSEALMNLNKAMAQRANIDARDHVLDAGCGQGGSALWLAANIGCTVSGITLVPHQVEIASKEAKHRNLQDKVKFFVADYTQTDFENASYDVVWACESLCHAADKKKFYTEAYRLLKAGGRLIAAEYIRNSRTNKPEDEYYLRHWCDGWSMSDLDTWDEHLKNMTDAGFVNANTEDVTKHTGKSLKKLYQMSKDSLWLGRLLNFFKIRNDIKHANQTASVSQYEALTRKLWYYSFITALKPI